MEQRPLQEQGKASTADEVGFSTAQSDNRECPFPIKTARAGKESQW